MKVAFLGMSWNVTEARLNAKALIGSGLLHV